MLKIINIVCLVLAAAWFGHSPDWEPAITTLTFLAGLLAQEHFTGMRLLDRAEMDKKLGSFQQRLEKAETSVCISGNDCKFVVESSSAAIDALLSRGIHLKLLLVEPASKVPEMLAQIDPRFETADQFRDSMKEVRVRLDSWRKRYPTQFEYRMLPVLPALGFFITDPDHTDGIVKIELYTAKEWNPINSRPHFTLGRHSGKWRSYFLRQWENYWNLANEPVA